MLLGSSSQQTLTTARVLALSQRMVLRENFPPELVEEYSVWVATGDGGWHHTDRQEGPCSEACLSYLANAFCWQPSKYSSASDRRLASRKEDSSAFNSLHLSQSS